MARPATGSVGSVPTDTQRAWRFNNEECLKQFVETVAKDKNEFIDEYMLKYAPLIRKYSSSLAGP